MPRHWTGTLANGCSDGRRRLDKDEMRAKGWELNDRGRWVDPLLLQASREAFAKAA